jgi:hypothetical protein
MEKLKNATKRIAAVGAASLIVASTAFGAGLSDYPTNFVENGKFVGKVVVGTGVGADDATAANSVIEDLRASFSGEQEKVVITYRDTDGGNAISAVDPRDTLNFGETLESVAEDLDSDVTELLEDGSVDNNDYNQELFLLGGAFEYRIFDEVDGEEVAKAGLYYDATDSFAKYVMTFEDNLDIDGAAAKEDLIGEEMVIMGNEFTIVEIDDDLLTLIGGSNKVSLGEGESTKVTVDGKSYDVSIQSVADEKVLLTVNGQSKSIDIYDTESLAGVSIAVTDLVSSSRDAVKGYAEIVIGGQKVELTDTRVKINDEDFDDVYDDYEVDVTFLGADATVFEGFEIEYSVDENVVLGKGDSLKDILFDSFELVYDGLNDVEYTELSITSDNDEVKFSGTMFNGRDIPSEFKLTTDDVDDADLYLGSTTNRIYFGNSSPDIVTLISDDRMDAINNDSFATPFTNLTFSIDAATSDVRDNMIWSWIADDDFYLYKITGVDRTDLELDFTDLIADKSVNAVDIDDVKDALEFNTGVASNVSADLVFDLTELGSSIMYLENELEMDFTSAEVAEFGSTGGDGTLTFTYNSDIEMDDNGNKSDTFQIEIVRADDPTDAIKLIIGTNDFVSSDDVEEDSDFTVYVDHYGTMVTAEEDDFDSITIAVPNKEVEAQVSIVFGEAGSTMTKTVDAADLDDVKAELEDDGFTIVSTETLASEEVEFDVAGVTLDTDVADMENLIVVGGPAVNAVARSLLGIGTYTIDQAGVDMGEGVVKYFADSNSVLVYGYSKADTTAAVARLNAGGLSGDEARVN